MQTPKPVHPWHRIRRTLLFLQALSYGQAALSAIAFAVGSTQQKSLFCALGAAFGLSALLCSETFDRVDEKLKKVIREANRAADQAGKRY